MTRTKTSQRKSTNRWMNLPTGTATGRSSYGQRTYRAAEQREKSHGHGRAFVPAAVALHADKKNGRVFLRAECRGSNRGRERGATQKIEQDPILAAGVSPHSLSHTQEKLQ